ncbi:hypothetical protein [Streptomyces sp. NPDC002088]|uniref:hypothetical protein n=1 Tax=Streptomyces sp. NPDC002088 TaxID=3154665 RepID=UPI003327FE74
MATSPFRSFRLADRESAADRLIAQREKELEALERRWRRETKTARQRQLLTRIQATKNNIVSWRDYIAQGCPRVANATTLV